jgi:hypothetical protein
MSSPIASPSSAEITTGRRGCGVEHALTRSGLANLVSGSSACIWIRGYLDAELCGSAVTAVLQAEPACGVTDDTSVVTIGPSFSSLSRGGTGPYVDQAVHFRNVLSDGILPIGRLQQDLSAVWPSGVVVPRLSGGEMLSHVFRVYRPGSRLRPHIDRACEDEIRRLCSRGRLALNLYLSTAEKGMGGDLMLWDAVLPEQRYEEVRFSEYGEFCAHVCGPALAIEPKPGDLILFDAQRIHCVGTLQQGIRVTMSCFLGIGEEGSALSMFA